MSIDAPRSHAWDHPAGLTIVFGYLDARKKGSLLGIDSMPWSHALRRRIQHYGYHYDCRRRRFGESRTMLVPSWLASLASQLVHDGWADQAPDQCTVNEYCRGKGFPRTSICRTATAAQSSW